MALLELIRYVLDRLGFDLFEIPEFNSRRSLVRIIGSNLPLSPAKRAKFLPKSLTFYNSSTYNNNSENGSVYSSVDCVHLADVGHLEEVSFVNGIMTRTEIRTCPNVSTPDSSAILRISELEDELSKLREQIAQIVIMQEPSLVDGDCAPGGPRGAGEPHIGLGTPNSSNSCMVLKALPLVACPPPPPCTPCAPPPPPCAPPPPPPPPIQTPKRSAIDLIRENRQKPKSNKPSAEAVPDMAQVLKGIGNVRLRAIERSPGGTPIRKTKPQSPMDPASLIAHALRKKFAHRVNFSPDGKSPDCSPKTSPVIVAPSLVKPSHFRTAKPRRLSALSPLAAE